MSYYKEQLAGETNNYIHMRACAEQMAPVNVLHSLCEELLDCNQEIIDLSGDDSELVDIWMKYVQVRSP